VVGAEPLKALLWLLALQVPLNGAVVLVVGVEPMGQLAIVVAVDQFLAAAAEVVGEILRLVFLNAVLAVELQFTLLALLLTQQILLV
jgi:hypothetical protein